MERRIFSRIFAIVLMVLLLLPLVMSATSAQEEEVLTFTYGQPSTRPPVHGNPFILGNYWGVCGLMSEPLAFYHFSLDEWIPWLATSWEFDLDEMTFTVHLREGVKWSDGAELTSKDVVSTYYCGRIEHWTSWLYLSDVKADGDYTVVFEFDKPWLLYDYYILRQRIYSYATFGRFSDAYMELLDEGAEEAEFDALKAELDAFKPEGRIGTGPYKLVTISDNGAYFVKRDEYWRGIDTVPADEYMQVYIGGAQQVPPMLAGSFDFNSPDVTAEMMKEIEARPYLQCNPKPGGFMPGLQFADRYPLNLLDVRRAIAYAINATEFNVGTIGDPRLAGTPEISVGMLKYQRELYLNESFIEEYLDPYEYDPDMAEQIFEDLGFTKDTDGIWKTENGTRLEWDVTLPAYGYWPVGAEMLAAQLGRVGIRLNIRVLETATYNEYDKYTSKITGIHMTSSTPNPHPWSGCDRFLVPPYYVSPGFVNKMVDVPWVGTVNVTDLVVELGSTMDPNRELQLVTILAYIWNHYLPFYDLRDWVWGFNYNTLRWVWPDPDDPFYSWHTLDEDYALGYALLAPLIHPVGAEPVGPVIPEELEEMVAETLASVQSMSSAVEDLKTAVEELKAAPAEAMPAWAIGLIALLAITTIAGWVMAAMWKRPGA